MPGLLTEGDPSRPHLLGQLFSWSELLHTPNAPTCSCFSASCLGEGGHPTPEEEAGGPRAGRGAPGGHPLPWRGHRQERLPWEDTARPQGDGQGVVVMCEWPVTTVKCYSAGVMGRWPLYFFCAQNLWANILESQYSISFRSDDFFFFPQSNQNTKIKVFQDHLLFKDIEPSFIGFHNCLPSLLNEKYTQKRRVKCARVGLPGDSLVGGTSG